MNIKTVSFSNKSGAIGFFNRLTKLGYGASCCGADNTTWTVFYFRTETTFTRLKKDLDSVSAND